MLPEYLYSPLLQCVLGVFAAKSEQPSPSAQHVVPLADNTWTVSNPKLGISVPGKYPSQAHLDLYAEQVIGDPYHGLNDFNLRWVAESNWTYSAPLTGLKNGSDATWLLFEGLDTFTSIKLCGKHVASTNNQFRQYYFDVTSILKNCSKPTLSIDFGSAPNIVDQIAAQPGQETWPYGVNLVYEFPNRWFMRKEQSDFGWDWGPAFAPAGPWLPGYVIQFGSSEAYVRNALVDVYKKGQMNNMPPDQSQPWMVNASLDYIGTLPSGARMTYTLKDPSDSNKTVSSGSMTKVNMTDNAINGLVSISNDLVKMWWPNGLGDQNLYYMTLSIADSANKTITTATRRIGFRTIVLNEDVVTDEQMAKGIAPGNNWHFEVNGHVFFAKGSNFIPPDAFWPRVTQERMKTLFDSVIEGNQNMLRVWASGAYSPDFMYSLADEMGILLWSEFEFGDSLYPVNQEFLDNVYEEANYQVRRVNYHPSLAFWAGGNELENLELSLVNNSSPSSYTKLKAQYEQLFLTTLFPAVFENTHSISYAPSSTSNGYISLNFTDAPYFRERYNDLVSGSVYGETDYYDYDATIAFDTSNYPVGRFSNEFGFHSMPSLQTWQQALDPADLHFNSSTIVLRNHHNPPGGLNTSNYANSSEGMAQMTEAVQLWYPTPNKTDSVGNFSAWCHATQIFQADYYTSQIQFYRRGSGLPQRTLGSLYWQLEDIWQAPTWAGIEYDGRWKVLHYRAKDAYRNVVVHPFFNRSTGILDVYVTSDLWAATTGTLDALWYDWSGAELPQMDMTAGVQGRSFDVGPINSTRVYSRNVSSLLATSHNSPDDALLRLNISATGPLPNTAGNQTFTHEAWFHPASLAEARLVDPGLQFDVGESSLVVQATQGVASWVWVDYPGGAVVAFEDNGFWLGKGERRTLGWTVKSDDTDGGWKGGIKVTSLWDSTLSD
ncbi:MAG: hypothetical protein M1828_004078 [Chrysothrix sp. TS-e1954]|nr:MAG: hypothetical protein M1828_004078 [Chrysothrix sp. TS-e1954]